MTGGSECAAGDKDVPGRTAQVPVGWQRKVENGAVAYISPSGTVLSSVEEVRAYLLTDSTCKCGLECPLVVHKVFNFDPVAAVRSQSQQPGKAEEDMTKLCNHRRKVVAMAALCRSMQASQLPLHASGSSFCSTEGRDQKGGPLAVHIEDGGHCTYSAQPRHSAKSNSNSALRVVNSGFPLSSSVTLLHNGSLPHSNSVLPSEAGVVSKRPSSTSPGCNSAGYGMPPWYPRPSTPQSIIQRLPPASGSPGSSKTGAHPSVLPLDVSLSSSSSSSIPLALTTAGRPGQNHPQGSGSVKSPSPISLCVSPSRTLDATSPHQRSRHSSASSTLSEHGGGGGLSGAKPPCPARSPLPLNAATTGTATPCLSPKVSMHHPPSPRGRLEGMLQHYKDCSSAGGSPCNSAPHPQSNQSNFQVPQNLPPYVAAAVGADRKNGPVLAPTSASAGGGGFLGLPLGQLLGQQKASQHVSSSFPASSLLSAAAKAQMASQKSLAHGGGGGGGAASGPPVDGSMPSNGSEKDPQQSKVLISTLNSSLPPSARSSLPMPAFLLPHAPSHPSAALGPLQAALAGGGSSEKVSRRKRQRQRRSPTVLSMLKESQLSSLRSVGDLSALSLPLPLPLPLPMPSLPNSIPSPSSSPSPSSTSSSPNTPLLSPPSEHLLAHQLQQQQQHRLSATQSGSLISGLPKQADLEELRRLGLGLGLGQPQVTPSPSQPLSALLQLLSMQNAQAAGTATAASSSSNSSNNSATQPSVPLSSSSSSSSSSPSPIPLLTSTNARLAQHTQALAASLALAQATDHCDGQPTQHVQTTQQQQQHAQSLVPTLEAPGQLSNSSQSTFPLIGLAGEMDGGTNANASTTNITTTNTNTVLKPNPNPSSVLNLSQPHVAASASASASAAQAAAAASASSSVSVGPTQDGGGSSSQILSMLGQLSSGSPCLPPPSPSPHPHPSSDPLADKSCGAGKVSVGPHDEVTYVSSQTQPMDTEGALVTLEDQDPSEAGLSLPATGAADSSSALQLAESFPFMNQEQLLQLLSANSGLPSLLPPFLGSLGSLGSLPLWSGLQQTAQATTAASTTTPSAQPQQQPQQSQQQQLLQQHAGLLGQTSPLNILPSISGAQGDFPVNLISLLNPPPPPPGAAAAAAAAATTVPVTGQSQAADAGDKPSLQALLMASLLLSQQQAAAAAMLQPIPGLGQLNLDLPPLHQTQQQSTHHQQQHSQPFPPLPDGLTLDKSVGAGLVEPVLPGPGLLEALQGLMEVASPVSMSAAAALSAVGPQSLLLSAASLPPPPPAFLSLNPALLAAAFAAAPPPPAAAADPLPTQQQSPPQAHSQGTGSSPAAGSTSVPCGPLLTSTVPEEMNSLVPLVEQDKNNGQNTPLLPPLLPPGMMGDLTGLGNIGGLHGLLGAGPLLLPQVATPPLGVPLSQAQGPLNPLACLINSLQLNVGPPLAVDKQLGLAEPPNPPQEEELPVGQLAQEPAPNPGHVVQSGAVGSGGGGGIHPPERESASSALFDPYGSFMDTIYTSFLQVSGKDAETGGSGGGSGITSSNPLSFPTPDLPALLAQAQASAPPSLSPRRACSVHNPDLSRLGMEAAQSPARGTPKLSEEASSTPPPSGKPCGPEAHPDEAPLPPAFLEEAKTDGSASATAALGVYSNGLASGPSTHHQQQQEEVEDGERPQPQGYLGPGGSAEVGEDNVGSSETNAVKEPPVRTGARRGRKRKQVLERVAEGPGGLDSIIEEPQVTTALPKPVRSTRGKRRRVVR